MTLLRSVVRRFAALAHAISAGIATVSLLSAPSAAQTAPLSAQQSDPEIMGWMKGFPPPRARIITQPDSVYFSFPKLRWSVCHLRELLPTEEISRGLGAPRPFEYPPPYQFANDRQAIDALTFTPIGSDKTMTWEESLSANYTDGLLIIHKGRVVYERYFGCLNPAGKHAAMSMTKSLTGLLASILVAEGKLNESAPVSDIIPEVKGKAYGSATVRQVMDMTTGLKFSEDYSDPDADIWRYSAAVNPLSKPEPGQMPSGYFDYLPTVEAQGEHGAAFHYKTIDADMLGWIVSRVSGKSVTELASEHCGSRWGPNRTPI